MIVVKLFHGNDPIQTEPAFWGGCQAPAAGLTKITLAVWPGLRGRCIQSSYQLVQLGNAYSTIKRSGAKHTKPPLETPVEHPARQNDELVARKHAGLWMWRLDGDWVKRI